MLPIQAVINCVKEKFVLTIWSIGFCMFAPKVGKTAYQTVNHKNPAFTTHPMSNPKEINFFRNSQVDNTISSFPSIITGSISGIIFIIGVAPIKYAITGVINAMKVPENIPQYRVATINMQFTAEPVKYTETLFNDWKTIQSARSNAVVVKSFVVNVFFIVFIPPMFACNYNVFLKKRQLKRLIFGCPFVRVIMKYEKENCREGNLYIS